jgi:transposase
MRAAHINGIEEFWSFAKRLYRHVHGVNRENLPLYLAEYTFRYNHCSNHLLTLLFDRLYRPILEKGQLP